MHHVVIIFLCIFSTSVAFFPWPHVLPHPHPDASKICIYSADPGKLAPKCFPCLNSVYPHALFACVNATSMPSNVSYTQAACIERNCEINDELKFTFPSLLFFKGKRSVRGSSEAASISNLIQHLFSENHFASLPSSPPNFTTTKETNATRLITTFASDMDYEITD